MVDAEVNDVGRAALGGERLGEAFERRIRRRLVLSARKGVERRTEQAVQQHIAGGPVQVVDVVDALLELDVDVHAKLARAGRCEANEVRLHRPGDEHGVGAACSRSTAQHGVIPGVVPVFDERGL